ncbi:MAG: DUF262 domain-containing protein [Colwellia sp.]
MNEKDYSDINEEVSESGVPTGIEAETGEEEVLEPFDPDAISITQKVVPMDSLIRRLKQETIHLSPAFQRNEVWDATRKSRLIESLMLHIPLPMFYVAADEEGRWEVVDGLQRLSTIRDFMIGDKDGVPLKLKNLEFLGEKYDGKTFKWIESEPTTQKLANDIFETEMRFTVINPGTPEAVKRNIFKRINTGGMPLTGQEIRHALYEGQSSVLLAKLVESAAFIRIMGKKVNDTRMGARELILRFVSFLVIDRESYKGGMDTWLSNAMRVINCMPGLDAKKLQKIYLKETIPKINIDHVSEIKERFELAMCRAEKVFDGHAFRKSLPKESRKSPINKSLFEVWSNVLSSLSEEEYEMVLLKKEILLEQYENVLYKLGGSNAISRHSSTAKGIVESYDAIHDLVRGILREDSE